MSRDTTPATVTHSTLLSLSASYPAAVDAQPAQPRAPKPQWPLAELDAFRFQELHDLIQGRRSKKIKGKTAEASDEATAGWVEKAELEKLMQWKLFRGVYRPALPGLISSNEASQVKAVTAAALAELDKNVSANKASSRAEGESYFMAPTLKILCKLRGVGPATASLVAAVAQPELVPFFSDELYAWVSDGEKGGEGRKHGLKYNEKEYRELWETVWEVRNRANEEDGRAQDKAVRAVDVERAAYVVRRPTDGLQVDGQKAEDKKADKRKVEAVVADEGNSKRRRRKA